MDRVRRACLAAGWLLAAGSTLAADLTAEQIVEKNIAARGGLAAWRAVSALTLTGEMDASSRQAARLPFVMQLKRPHKTRLEINFAGQTAIQTFDGQQGWKLRPYLNRNDVEPLNDAELKAEVATDELDGPLIDHERKGIKVQLAGHEELEGRDNYRLKLTGRDGLSRMLLVDAKTFLETRIDGQPRRMDGKMRRVTVAYKDFKKVGSVMVPHVLETSVVGTKQVSLIVVTKVELNASLDDTLFAKPKALPAAAPNS